LIRSALRLALPARPTNQFARGFAQAAGASAHGAARAAGTMSAAPTSAAASAMEQTFMIVEIFMSRLIDVRPAFGIERLLAGIVPRTPGA
jgi:hypothetical protein